MVDENDRARRLFRRNSAKQAWWLVIGLIVVTAAVGLSSDVGAARVETVGPILGMMMGGPVGVILGYLGVSAWEAKTTRSSRRRSYGGVDDEASGAYDYGASTGNEVPP